MKLEIKLGDKEKKNISRVELEESLLGVFFYPLLPCISEWRQLPAQLVLIEITVAFWSDYGNGEGL